MTDMSSHEGSPMPEFGEKSRDHVKEITGGEHPPSKDFWDKAGRHASEVVSPAGGRRQRLGERWDLIPYEGLVAVAEIMDYGATKYEDDNWKKINFRHSEQAPINHAIGHAYKALTEPFGSDARRQQLARTAANLLMQLWGEAQGERQDAADEGVSPEDAALALPLSILDRLKDVAGLSVPASSD